MRRIALVRARGALAVAAQERVLRLRARAVGSAFRVAAEAAESVGAAGEPVLDASQARRVVDRFSIRFAAAPAVLGAEEVAEELVAHDEERIDAERSMVEIDLGERGVLDQLARVARIEDAVEVLATAQIDRVLELLCESDVVGYRNVFHRELPTRRRRLFIAGRTCVGANEHDDERCQACEAGDGET